jgi:hypothetical protein
LRWNRPGLRAVPEQVSVTQNWSNESMRSKRWLVTCKLTSMHSDENWVRDPSVNTDAPGKS